MPVEWGPYFTSRLPTVNNFECNHVVNKIQVFARCIPRTPSGRSIVATYQAKKEIGMETYCENLGLTVAGIMKNAPRGSGGICFLSSYKDLMDCNEFWEKLNVRALCGVPILFEEPGANQAEFERLKQTYVKNIDERRGCLLVAVYRGKMSEGISFNDKYCRVVFCVGIPYPSFKDPRVKYQRMWSDIQHKIDSAYPDGDVWYEQEAYRALNQALGRCIRHRHDYGCLFLLDSRFSSMQSFRASKRDKVCTWIKNLLQPDGQEPFAFLQDELLRFFRHARGYVTDLQNNPSASQLKRSVSLPSQVSTGIESKDSNMSKRKNPSSSSGASASNANLASSSASSASSSTPNPSSSASQPISRILNERNGQSSQANKKAKQTHGLSKWFQPKPKPFQAPSNVPPPIDVDDPDTDTVEIVTDDIRCPISLEIFKDPVVCLGDCQTYERKNIEDWLKKHDTSPVTNEVLKTKVLIPNGTVRKIIKNFAKKE